MLNGGKGRKNTDTRPHYLLAFCAMGIIFAVQYIAMEFIHQISDLSVAPHA